MALWIVATPIGTLADLSPRGREVLQSADLIVAEDTRRTRKLLSAVGVSAPELKALHAHNEAERADAYARRAADAQVALVCDAGTPGVSDPGRLLVAACLRAGVEIRSVPGPSALATALAASGLPAAPSTFLGFPPRKGLAAFVALAATRPETIVFYEAPGRVLKLLRAWAEVAPHREAVVCRELSKRFEQVLRGPLPSLVAQVEPMEIRGECVVLIGPGEPVAPATVERTGESTGQVATALAARWGVKKRDVYQGLLALERDLKGN